MTVPELTLENVKKQAKVKVARASDFLTKEEMDEVKISNLRGKAGARYTKVDAYIAEMIARFGYHTYMAWKKNDISDEQMAKYMEAERIRELKSRISLESIIVASVAGANHPSKSGQSPRSLKKAIDVIKKENKIVKGAE